MIDDSALVRKLLTEIINQQPDFEVVGAAQDPLIAREMIKQLNPDVLTLDVEMPRMDGIDFLGRLMRLRPMPVIMVSTLTQRGAEVTLKALELGAVDFVAKPKIGLNDGLAQLARDIVDKLRIAAAAHVRRLDPLKNEGQVGASGAAGMLGVVSTEKMVCIGSSTGGTEAVRELLSAMPADSPATVITQHMPPGFTANFAARLNNFCAMTVKEAVNKERLLPGHAYIAPGGMHLRVERSGANYVAIVEDAEPVNRHKPSVEVLFKSCAKVVGPNAFGIMLTGMGNDGAMAMREMKDAGSYNYVQDEASCVVFGMPKEAIAAGAAHEILPLKHIAPALIAKLKGQGDRHRI